MSHIPHPFQAWEDYKHGLYALRYDNREQGAQLAIQLLSDPEALWAAMSAVAREWPYAAEHNLSDESHNRRSWLGQAAVCFVHGVPAEVTGAAWWGLTETQRTDANTVADQVINEWEVEHGDRLF